ncbi:MAG: glycoside hydrolase family 15 protein [Sulfobacillus sp.]
MMAPGWPGVEPTWTTGAKTAVGTAIAPISRVWFTIAKGIITEVYYPRLDNTAIRDAQFLIRHRSGEFWEEQRDLRHTIRYLTDDAPGFEMVSEERQGRFRIIKRVVTWTQGAALVLHVRWEWGPDENPADYRLFWLVAPHLENQGRGNCGRTITLRERPGLVAWCHTTTLCMAGSVPFLDRSVGYVGVSDGWQLVQGDRWQAYDEAMDGNIALTAELDPLVAEQTLVLGFGRTLSEAAFTVEWVLLEPYARIESQYLEEWRGYFATLPGLLPKEHPRSQSQRIAAMVLRVHRGKLFAGGMTASLSIPWGEAAGDGNLGGYHLVWSRDMVEAAQALAALGDWEGTLDAVKYLCATQAADGSWPQNFWLDGQPYWPGSQLDETAMPIHLAYRLEHAGQLEAYPAAYDMVRKAIGYLVRWGPVTEQDRWEENAGYSPATLASTISALVLGADLMRGRGQEAVARYAEDVADYWSNQIEAWTLVEDGDLVPDHPRYYERIHPAGAVPEDHVHRALVALANQAPGTAASSADQCLVDGGFLRLVRYGLRAPEDPGVTDTLAVYDALLKTETPYGPVWHRYNGDGYGEPDDGSPYTGWGRGRGWPLLTGERGHYALAAGQDAGPYLDAMERMTSTAGMLPEQVWDAADMPERGLFKGRPTGSAMPLVWAHAEYIKLLRSQSDGVVWECWPLVRDRYRDGNPNRRVFWLFTHQRRTWAADARWVRIAIEAPADVIWTTDAWQSIQQASTQTTDLGVCWVDISVQGVSTLEWTFYWTDEERWEGRNWTMRAAEPMTMSTDGGQAACERSF